MENYKETEKQHYDEQAKRWLKEHGVELEHGDKTDVSGMEVLLMRSYAYVYKLLKQSVYKKTVLDYGCGHGMHTVPIAEWGGYVTGIDISEESLKIARARAFKAGVEGFITFIQGDCEALPFKEDSFEIVFDGGTFSSLDLRKAFPEIHRVLKPGGILVGIETLGHNPLTNLKRWLNRRRGIRTGWAADHIFKMQDYELAKQYFEIEEVRFFHLFSIFAFPLRRLPGGKLLFRALEIIDIPFLAFLPFIRRFGFKTVFVMSKRERSK